MVREKLMVLLACALIAGCARHAGTSAVKGAASEVREQAEHPQGPPPLAIRSKNMVIGALDELERPERQAQLTRIMGAMMRGILASAEGSESPQLGWGGGPPSPAAPS